MGRGATARGAFSPGGSVPRPMARVAPRPARVLLVDDLSYVRDALAELLRGAGYEVVAVGSGPAALTELERQGADLLLTDLYMPEMTGWDLVRAVRARSSTSTRGLPLCVGLYSAVLSGFSREQLARAQVDFAVAKSTCARASCSRLKPLRTAE